MNRQFNTRQRFVVLMGLLVLACMTLIPPWSYSYKTQSQWPVKRPAGYHFLLTSSSLCEKVKVRVEQRIQEIGRILTAVMSEVAQTEEQMAKNSTDLQTAADWKRHEIMDFLTTQESQEFDTWAGRRDSLIDIKAGLISETNKLEAQIESLGVAIDYKQLIIQLCVVFVVTLGLVLVL